MFAAAQGETSLLEQTAGRHYFMFRIDGVEPARDRPLADVRGEVDAAGRRGRAGQEGGRTRRGAAAAGTTSPRPFPAARGRTTRPTCLVRETGDPLATTAQRKGRVPRPSALFATAPAGRRRVVDVPVEGDPSGSTRSDPGHRSSADAPPPPRRSATLRAEMLAPTRPPCASATRCRSTSRWSRSSWSSRPQ